MGHLVLNRRAGQTIVIDDDIRVTVVSTMNGSVRISVNAPNHISVDREEIWEKKKKEDKNAKTF